MKHEVRISKSETNSNGPMSQARNREWGIGVSPRWGSLGSGVLFCDGLRGRFVLVFGLTGRDFYR